MSSATSTGPASDRRRKRGRLLLAAVVVILLALIVPPLVQINLIKGRVVGALEAGLGRRVSVESVSLRLLPRPGFDLRRLVVSEDPAFGYEPMLRADEVTASFRLLPIWIGRLEIARITFKSGRNINPPSLNLVVSPDGRWNIESLIERTSRTPSAPTALPHAESRPRFPYIESQGGRINFKVGVEKKVHALVDSDFALWLDSENEWAFRLTARPMRGDLNLMDAGQVRINGRFRRATELRDTPLELTASLQQAQLGELSKFIFGDDRGWRGTFDYNLQLSGTPSKLKLQTRAAVSDLRRYDVGTTDKLNLQLRCSGLYNAVEHELAEMECRLPFGGGAITAKGGVYGASSPRAYDFKVTAEDVALDAFVSLVRHARKDVPADLRAEGALNGSFTLRKIERGPAFLWEGSASTTKGALRSAVLQPEISLPPLALAIDVPGLDRRKPAAARATQPTRVALAAVPLALGGNAPAEFRGWFSAPGYELSLTGDTRIPRLFQLGRALGLRTPEFSIEGAARVDLKTAANWLSAPVLTGTAQLHTVSIPMRGLNAPVEIAAAQFVLTPAQARLDKLSARFSGVPVNFTGSVTVTRGCEALEQCPIEFALDSSDLNTDGINQLVNPAYAKRAWYKVFGDTPISTLGRLQARGRFAVARFTAGTLVATKVNANAELKSGKLRLTDLRADLLGGKHQGEWTADFTGEQPAYEGRGKLASAAAPQLAALLHAPGWTGQLAGEYNLKLKGWTAAEFAASASASGSFDWRAGTLPHLMLNQQPARFSAFTAQAALKEGKLTFTAGKLATPRASYDFGGAATLARELSLTLRNPAARYEIAGTLDKPRVTEAPHEPPKTK